MASSRSLARTKYWLNYNDLRTAARRRLPKGLFEFIDRGTEDEHAVRDNPRALSRIKLVPRVLRDVSQVDIATQLLGKPCDAPLIVAPTGAAGLAWHRGELALAKAAAQEGIPFTLSTASLTPMEDIARDAGGNLWFQLYLWPDRGASYQLVDRVRQAGYETLMVTVDTAVMPNREYNVRNGFSVPIRATPQNALDVALHPRWAIGVMARYLLTSGMPRHENYPDNLRQSLVHRPQRGDGSGLATPITWDEIGRLRERWGGQLVLKGILHPEDARKAASYGVDALVISNHGGRNLDCAVSPIQQIPDIREAVGRRLTLLADSGFTRGSDVVKALALGADGVLLGRMPLWGAAAGGEAGARHAIHLMKQEIKRVLSFTGHATIRDLDSRLIAGGPDAASLNENPVGDYA